MGFLVLIAVVCFAGITVPAALLWVAVQRRHGRPATPSFQPQGSVRAAMAGIPAALFLHPRMDLASGRAPRNQAVDLDRRRTRREEHAAANDAWSEEPSREDSPPGSHFEPFAVRRQQARTCRQRLDLLYARETMGDLSDPDVRSLRGLYPVDLQAASTAK